MFSKSPRGNYEFISVGLKQDLVPTTSVGAFRIHEEVFVNINGFIQLTNLKITPNQTEDVCSNSLEQFEIDTPSGSEDFNYSNIVNFTFEKTKCNKKERRKRNSESYEELLGL